MDPLTGIFDHRIDGKDRVVIPAQIAQVVQADSSGRLFLVPSADSPCLEAYPAREYERRAETHVPDRFAGDQTQSRLFFHLAARVELKGPGRITIPKRFLPYFPAGVVRVAGMNTYLELWDPDAWEDQVGGRAGAFPMPPARPGPG